MVTLMGVVSSRPSGRKGYCSAALASRQIGTADAPDSSVDGEGTMPNGWDEHDDVAAGSSCPMPDCGALVVAYRSADGVGRDHSEPLEFTCQRCGIDFTVAKDDLIFQGVPRNWLLARVQAA